MEKKTVRSKQEAARSPEFHPPAVEESGLPQVDFPAHTADLRAFLDLLFRVIVAKRKTDIGDPSHALLQARFKDFEDRIYGSDRGGIVIGQTAGASAGNRERRVS